VLFVPAYGDYCGNGFAGGSKGRLASYIPPGEACKVEEGKECGYYPESGWNCGEMVGSSAPDCVND
jgi:hypothetical protein